jgi:uncharacterized DUF497 family protein
MQFEWDDNKAKRNERKHQVSFSEAMTSFYDPRQVAFYDIDHSNDEDRELLLGHSSQGRLLLSARRATRREEKDYARGI